VAQSVRETPSPSWFPVLCVRARCSSENSRNRLVCLSCHAFVRNADGTLASESSIIRYTLSEEEYCEWVEYTTRNNLDAPGVTNEAPPVSSHCTLIKKACDRIFFAPPGESVTTTYDRSGLAAVIKGQFTDHWRKIN
jgi:hypothetical protein